MTNEVSEPIDNIHIHDLRKQDALQHEFDNCGFTFARQDFSCFSKNDFINCESLRAGYVLRMEDWLKELLGAESVSTLSVNIRRRDVKFPAFTWGTSGDVQPIQGVHVGEASRYPS